MSVSMAFASGTYHLSEYRGNGFTYLLLLRVWTETTNSSADYPFRVTPLLVTLYSGAGILTGCPSPTAFALGLGPAKLRRTNLALETLGFRRGRFSLPFSLLVPAFSLPLRPEVVTVLLQPTVERSSTTRQARGPAAFAASVTGLRPDYYRRRNARPVSCYALFK